MWSVCSLETLQARYEAGERDEAFVKQYMEVLYKAYRPKLQKEVVTAYIDSLSEKEFYSRPTWELIIKNLSDPLSPLVKKVMANKYRFYPVVARDTVDIYLDYTYGGIRKKVLLTRNGMRLYWGMSPV